MYCNNENSSVFFIIINCMNNGRIPYKIKVFECNYSTMKYLKYDDAVTLIKSISHQQFPRRELPCTRRMFRSITSVWASLSGRNYSGAELDMPLLTSVEHTK